MNRLVVGVIGHVDHGKSALVKALTGEDTDRLAEEKARGITIALGFASLGGTIDLIDMPGHERFVRTMIAGATGIDAVLLVVAANEGVKPQTIEHVEIAALLGIRRAVVAVSKCDLASVDEAALVAEEALELLARCGFAIVCDGTGISPLPGGEGLSVVLTSTLRNQGIDTLRTELLALASQQNHRPTDGLAFLPIDRAFSMTGHGPVVTGTLRGAAIVTGDKLELLPAGRGVRVRAVQVHGEKVERALPGQRAALNLRDVDLAGLERGMALAAPGSLVPSDWLTIAIRAVAGAPPLSNGKRLRALLGTGEVEVRLRLLDRDALEPGDSAFAQLRCSEPVALPAGEHVILRLPSPVCTVAGGRLLEAAERRLKRNSPPVLQRLAELRDLPPAGIIAGEVQRAAAAGTTLRHLSRLTALSPARVTEMLQPLAVDIGRGGEVLPSAERERRRQLKPRPPDEAQLRADAEWAGRIAETLHQAGLTPPLPKDLVVDAASNRAVERLLRDGTLIRATDRDKGKELLFHRDAVAKARRILTPLLASQPGLLVSEIAGALGISRKFCMPLLDHLDSVRFTRRQGDKRVLYAAPSAMP